LLFLSFLFAFDESESLSLLAVFLSKLLDLAITLFFTPQMKQDCCTFFCCDEKADTKADSEVSALDDIPSVHRPPNPPSPPKPLIPAIQPAPGRAALSSPPSAVPRSSELLESRASESSSAIQPAPGRAALSSPPSAVPRSSELSESRSSESS
ncbi:hypothetical protein BaRGS_00010011, partial [Batillaria attramentaria]